MTKEDIVDKNIIAQRKSKYGNNFPMITELWNNYLQNRPSGQKLTPQDIAILMALMKISRLANCPGDKDSLTDLINYFYIALNYNEYLEFDVTKD